MSNQTDHIETKKRKALYISIAFHACIIISLLIILPFWKTRQKDTVKINEIELFTPPTPAPEQTAKPNQPEQTNDKEKEPEIAVPADKAKPKRPAPEPLQSDLKNKIIRQWDSIEKKNLQNQ
ncbi:MAG: hypothetical protein RBU23_08675 [Candidatus Auribacterota bacterium]|jgi:hypothetical protein|nr:hypothetical protein [Candidatus Auribacterota bacterium]